MWLFIFLAGCRSEQTTTFEPAPDEGKVSAQQKEVPPSKTISILSWNVESGGNDPDVIADQLRQLGEYDIYCLQEVHSRNFDRYAEATGLVSINSKSGAGDRLQILFDDQRFQLLEQKELMEHRGYVLNNGTHRSPLYVRLQDKNTGVQIIVMTNHLARGSAELRKEQAIGLREWARDQSVGVINIGDFNMDFDFPTGRGNDAFPEILRDNIFSWIKPVELIDTNWADRNNDGVDDYPDSMLDFAFVAGPAKEWKPVCHVIVREGDFPDDETTSDHRPIELRLKDLGISR